MRFADACFTAVVALTILGVSHADDGLPYDQKKDVVYAEAHGTGLLMDVFTPKRKPNGLGIVDIASGSWYSDRNKIRDHTLAQVYTIFCSRGYTVFAVRPGSKTRYTAAEMDRNVKSAIRHVKARAGEYKIDPTRLGLTGGSAGGHLATLAALTPEPGKADAKNSIDQVDTSVRAVGVFFPPTDFLDWDGNKAIKIDVLGPLLFVGGANGHSEDEIVEALTKAGGSAELIVKPGGGHPWLTLPQEVKVMADWFDKQLVDKTIEGDR
jgi:acetyl esterase/lipase